MLNLVDYKIDLTRAWKKDTVFPLLAHFFIVIKGASTCSQYSKVCHMHNNNADPFSVVDLKHLKTREPHKVHMTY